MRWELEEAWRTMYMYEYTELKTEQQVITENSLKHMSENLNVFSYPDIETISLVRLVYLSIKYKFNTE